MSLTAHLAEARDEIARLQGQAQARGITLPAPPEQQHESVCCGRGCHPCMFTYYFGALQAWREKAGALIGAAMPGPGRQP